MEPSENANYFCPVTSIPTSVSATFEKDTIILVKIDPYEPWGDFEFKVVEEKEKPSPKKFMPPENQGPDENMAGDAPNADPAAADPVVPGDDAFGMSGDAGGKPCPACTYMNFAGDTTCDICGTKL